DLARALDVAPHGARDLAVELRNRVGAAGEAEPGDGHVEGIAADGAHLRLAQAAAGAQSAELAERVDLVAGGDGRVRGDHGAFPQRSVRQTRASTSRSATRTRTRAPVSVRKSAEYSGNSSTGVPSSPIRWRE